MPCCFDFSCDAFKTPTCPQDDFARALQAVFKPEWAVNRVGSSAAETPLCLYGKGPLFCHHASTNAALVPFLAKVRLVSTRILGRRTRLSQLFVFLTESRMV